MNPVEMMKGRGEEQKDGTGMRLDNTTEILRILRFGEGESFSSGFGSADRCASSRTHIHERVAQTREGRASHP